MTGQLEILPGRLRLTYPDLDAARAAMQADLAAACVEAAAVPLGPPEIVGRGDRAVVEIPVRGPSTAADPLATAFAGIAVADPPPDAA